MKNPCKICDGLGKVHKMYPWDSINRQGFNYIVCKNCNGKGWIDLKNNPHNMDRNNRSA